MGNISSQYKQKMFKSELKFIIFYFLGGRILNYSDGILSDDEILNNNKYILMKQDPNNTESYNNTYKLILGIYNEVLKIIKIIFNIHNYKL